MTGRITLATAILGSALLLAAPAAWGDPWAADRADRAGSAVRPDDRAGMLGVGAVSMGEPYTRDLVSAAPLVAVASSPSGFDWGDAGIGAGIGAVAMALLGFAVIGGRRQGDYRVRTS